MRLLKGFENVEKVDCFIENIHFYGSLLDHTIINILDLIKCF